MITGNDAKKEDKKMLDVLFSDAPLAEKLKAIGKGVSIAMRIALNNRVNLVKVMEKLDVAKVQPKAKDEKEEK